VPPLFIKAIAEHIQFSLLAKMEFDIDANSGKDAIQHSI
jgi:hypothetical protein